MRSKVIFNITAKIVADVLKNYSFFQIFRSRSRNLGCTDINFGMPDEIPVSPCFPRSTNF